MPLTIEEMQFIMELVGREVVVPETKDFPFQISRRGHGYHSDPKHGQLQAKLSMMIEVKHKV